MNILLLGNGFDLYHKLPTKYDNFLHTVDFLIRNYTPDMKTVADVFGDERLWEMDSFIRRCYEKHKTAYAEMLLDKVQVDEIIKLAKDNYWFKYFLNSFDKGMGWIDFEKEIAFVVSAFDKFLDCASVKFNLYQVGRADKYILNQFSFFFERDPNGNVDFPYKIKNEYLLEYPLGSRNVILNREKIINYLFNELKVLSNILKLYLNLFIEDVLASIKGVSELCPALKYSDEIISFNYTNTYEKLYANNPDLPTSHIHGNVSNKVVLGINPDKKDEREDLDVSFVQFKKYHQRTIYSTDRAYLSLVGGLNDKNENYSLLVMGHSLDVTDSDIIEELFDKMDDITILYHDEIALRNYVSNLIKIFGKTKFDNLRKNKRLKFLSLNEDLTDFVKFREECAQNKLIKQLTNRIFNNKS